MGKRWITWKAAIEKVARIGTVAAIEFFVIVYLRIVHLTASSFERVSQLLFFAIIFTTPADVVLEALLRSRTTKKLEFNVNSLPLKIGACCAFATLLSSMVLDFSNGVEIAFWLLGIILTIYIASLLIVPMLIAEKPQRRSRKKKKAKQTSGKNK